MTYHAMSKIPRITFALLTISIIATCGLHAANPALLISARDFDSMMDSARTIQAATSSKDTTNFEKSFLEQAGTPNATGIDKSRAWHFGIWSRGAGSSLNVYFIPVTNFKEFKKALEKGKDFRGRDNLNVIRKSGKYAVIFRQHKRSPELSEEWIKAVTSWGKEAPKSIDSVYRLNILIEPPLRTILKAGLQGLKSMAELQAKSAQGKKQTSPLPFAAINEIFGLYYEFGALIVDGVEQLTLDINVDAEQITITDQVKPVKGSELAKLLKPAAPNLARFAPNLSADSAIVFAGHMAGSKFLRNFMSQAMTISAKMQGTEDAALAKHMKDFLDNMLPMNFAGSFDMGPGFRFIGIYEFPEQKGNQAFADFAKLTEAMTKAQIGKNSVYSDYQREAAVRKVNGIPVDRITLTLNTNAPMFQLPGQLEAFQLMAPDNKMAYEFAGKGRRVFYAMGAPIEAAIRKPRNPATLRVSIEKNTVLAARYNMLKFMQNILPNAPIKIPGIADALTKLDTEGTGIDIKADVNGQLSGEIVVPLKFLTQFNEFIKASTAANRKKATKPAKE